MYNGSSPETGVRFADNSDFRSYLRGGIQLPQRRAGINITLLAQKLHPLSHFSDWSTLCATNLTPSQIEESWDTMVRLHTISGVCIPECPEGVKFEMMQNEWKKGLGGLVKSLSMYMTPSLPLSSKPLDFLKEECVQEVQNYFVGRADELAYLGHISRTASNFLGTDLKDIRRLFIFCNSSPHSEIGKTRDIIDYALIARTSNIASDPHLSPIQCMIECENTMREFIKTRLEQEYPGTPSHWLTWGFSK